VSTNTSGTLRQDNQRTISVTLDYVRKHPSNTDQSQWEKVARFLGTPRYLLLQTIFVVCWVTLNVIGLVKEWDPYPFILLNLCFSTQAAYAAPILMLAANKSEERDRDQANRDYEHNLATLKLAYEIHKRLSIEDRPGSSEIRDS
jgi:uncharacterized membrane protein